MAYSMIALNILKMQVTINLSIAFNLLEAAAGALALMKKRLEAMLLITENLLDIIEDINYDKE